MGVDYEGYFGCDEHLDMSSGDWIQFCLDNVYDDYDEVNNKSPYPTIIYSAVEHDIVPTVKGYYSTKDKALKRLVMVITDAYAKVGRSAPTEQRIIDKISSGNNEFLPGTFYYVSEVHLTDYDASDESMCSEKYVACLVGGNKENGESKILGVSRQRSTVINKLADAVENECRRIKEDPPNFDALLGELAYNYFVSRGQYVWWIREYRLDTDANPYFVG